MIIMQERINDHGYGRIKTFKDLDDRYTAQKFWFENAEDYWRKAACKPFLTHAAVQNVVANPSDGSSCGLGNTTILL